MTTTNDVNTKCRFRLLHKLYEITGGVAERHALDIKQIGEEMGIGPFIVLETFDFLRAEGLAKWVASGYKGTITFSGLEEVQDALNEKASIHFPANIIALANSPDVDVEADAEAANKLKQDKLAAAQARAAADNAHVERQITISKETHEIGMRQLAEALTALRIALSAKAATVDDYVALGHVAQAEKAALNHEAQLVFDHLTQVTNPEWSISCTLGIEIAIANVTYKVAIDL